MKHFVLEPEQYQRNLDVLTAYRRDAALYLHKRTGRPLDECQRYVEQSTGPGGKFAVTDPTVLALSKNKHQDRETIEIPFTQYLDDVVRRKAILSPTLATYLSPHEKKSLLAMYIAGNIKRRSAVKHEMFEAEQAGNKELEVIKDITQSTFKIKNNALSGAHSSPFTPLYLKSAHSTLTSTCRSATGYGNANNEKFLYGNRHYWSPDVVKANIVSIVNNTDYNQLTAAMTRYGIRAPSATETMECITYSTDLYWRNAIETQAIFELVEALSDLERTAFVYTGDLYHLAKYNDAVVRTFLGRLSAKATHPTTEADNYIRLLDSDLKAFVSLLCAKELVGTDMKKLKVSDPHAYAIVGATARDVMACLGEYQEMIHALWVTPNVPASVAALPSSIRRGAITSDTDSTIFTVQDWTRWYVGKVDFSETSLAIAHTCVYLASQTIIHVLAKMTANMGVVPEQIHQLAMKNEYAFPVFSLTSRSKHYFAYISAREGNVKTNMDVEIKGVALKSSNRPPNVMKQLRTLITDTMDMVMSGEGVSIHDVLGRVSGLEQEIRNSVEGGRYEYLTTKQLRSSASYKQGTDAPAYLSYEMWNEVFGEKYGHTPPPPYFAVQVSVEADNPTKLKAWLAGMEDRAIAEKMEAWLARRGKQAITSLLLPESICAISGVPKEIISAINIRKLIYATMEPFYLILESLGLYMVNNNHTRLVSDYYHPKVGLTDAIETSA